MPVFTAIHFETATRRHDSVCAAFAVRVEHGRVVERYRRLVRPASPRFEYTPLHGIAWAHVHAAPSFARIWPELRALLRGADFVVAHDASREMAILTACCENAAVRPPPLRVLCTMQAARAWGLRPPTLSAVARHLGLGEPRDRGAQGDAAETCAEIALAARLAA